MCIYIYIYFLEGATSANRLAASRDHRDSCPKILRRSTAISVLTMFVLQIPGSRFQTSESQKRIQDLQGPPTNLRGVQTLN